MLKIQLHDVCMSYDSSRNFIINTAASHVFRRNVSIHIFISKSTRFGLIKHFYKHLYVRNHGSTPAYAIHSTELKLNLFSSHRGL